MWLRPLLTLWVFLLFVVMEVKRGALYTPGKHSKDLSQDTQGLTFRFATNDSCYIDMNHPIHFRSYDLAFIPISYEYVRNIVCVLCRGECVHMCVLLYPCMCIGKARGQGQLSPSIALHLTVLSQGLTLVLDLTM